MRKYIAVPLTCALAMMALTGCTDPSTLYENNDLVAQGTTSYKVAEWSQSSLTDEGTIDYAAGAVSLTGAKEAFSFTMHADSANLDVYNTRKRLTTPSNLTAATILCIWSARMMPPSPLH